MNKHLWVCSYNPHHQIYIRNRIYLKHVMAELRKSSLASVLQDLWKHQVESCLLFVNQDCCWKKTKQPSSCFFLYIVMFSEYKGTTGDLVNTQHCGAADRTDQSPSASAVTTLHLNSTGTSYRLQYIGITWDGGWCERPHSAQADRHSSPGLSQSLLSHGKIPRVYSTVIATTGRSSFFFFFPLAWNLSHFVFKKQLLPIKAQSYSTEELFSKEFNSWT